jgi:sugar (pentulose or hexulose) kinase
MAIGLDVGTSSVKAAAFGPTGNREATVQVPMPPLKEHRAVWVQDPEAVAARAEEALDGLVRLLPSSIFLRVALTTQRDTLLLVGADGGDPPRSPLLSWRERRHLEDPELRARLLGGASIAAGARLLSLERWLLERWSGGIPVPGLAGAPVRWAGGDKNCEYLAAGATPDRPEFAVISLGSAIALGVAVPGTDPPPVRASTGVVVSPMAGGPPGWNVETGILSGVQGMGDAAAWAGVPAWSGPLPPVEAGEGLGVVPHFGGALDDPAARPRLEEVRAGPERVSAETRSASPASTPVAPATAFAGAGPHTPERVAAAWARGVVRELRRLLPGVEAAGGTPVERLVLVGGGASDPGWEDYFREGWGLPVSRVDDPWIGCRGAVEATGGG